MYADLSNPYVPYRAPAVAWNSQQQLTPEHQPSYPFVAEGVSDAVRNQQHRDTAASSAASRTSSGIPAGRSSAASYPVISPAGLDQDPKEQHKQQAAMFPDIQLNKDTAARPVLSAPPVAVTQQPAPQGNMRLPAAHACLSTHTRPHLPTQTPCHDNNNRLTRMPVHLPSPSPIAAAQGSLRACLA